MIVPRQEPGRYFEISFAAPLVGSWPQTQEATAEPAVIGVRPVAVEEGWSTIAFPLEIVLMPVTTT